MKIKGVVALAFAIWFMPSVATAAEPVTKLKEVVVTAQEDGVRHLPDVEGAKIYAGKKTSVVDLEDAPQIVNNNYRQAFEKTPGLLVSEESTPLVSIGYRGLNPDRAQFMQVLKDGISIQADIIGYPEAYYTPPLQLIEKIEFVRGGSALMYGPQPGGAINYVTRDPYEGSFSLETENSFGSHDFYSNTTALSGTSGDVGHLTYFHHRQAQGFRDFNSQYEVYYGGSKVVYAAAPDTKWTLVFDAYKEEHGEPGGLTRAQFDLNDSVSTRLMDHFELNRYAGSLTYEREVSPDISLEWKSFGSFYERLSWRQRGGGFGTLPTGATATTNDIQSQIFYTGGTDLRAKREYEAFGEDGHALTAGVFYYHTTSPREEERGTTPDADSGQLRKESDRRSDEVSFFMENLFRFGAFSVTPGVRLENIWQNIHEDLNLDKAGAGTPLADQSEYDFVPLFGIGAGYDVTQNLNVYTNVSQAYRPKLFAESAPLGTNEVVNENLEEGKSWQAEAGVRGKMVPSLSWDASVFHMEFEDQVGTVGNTTQNVGDAEYDGAELAVEWDLCRWWHVFINATFLDAEFVDGPNLGRTPQYAPTVLTRTGVEYTDGDRVSVRFAGTFADDAFGDDSNSAQRVIPSYKVWDLTMEAKVYKDIVRVFAGINNVFDEHYFSRVTSAGIDPADGRNVYGGVAVRW